MNTFISVEDKLIIICAKTKASKYISKNFENLGLKKIFSNYVGSFGKPEIDLSIFGYTEEITASKYVKMKEIDISN